MLGRVSRPSARTAGVLLAWLAAVAAATLAGMVAVGAIGNGIISAGERPLSEADVSRLLAASSTTPPAPPSSSIGSTVSTVPTSGLSPGQPPTGQSAPPGQSQVFSTAGGTVIARCSPGIEVVSATPAQGYRVKDVEPDDGGLRVRFETGSGGTRVEVQLTCAAGVPSATTRVN